MQIFSKGGWHCPQVTSPFANVLSLASTLQMAVYSFKINTRFSESFGKLLVAKHTFMIV